ISFDGGGLDQGTSGNRWATGYFTNMDISGNLSKGSGTFRIDHPLDPTNKWLNHSFVESDEVLNIYRGKVTLNNQGRATVTMPDWFLEINTEFSYSLTCTGSHSDVFISK
ncbi:MAG: hypothetical protein GWN00_15265, partial [Aliifodinibius sp.]|nr:hypothetical protein [Fodinibius sp.]NIY26113.1 hypothetical protein [Fodinibius sp.]